MTISRLGRTINVATTYHRGDVPTALRAATVELMAEKGASGFSLREVARRAGVSHAAQFCWSTMQELVVLSPNLAQIADDTVTSAAPIEEIFDQFATFMLQGMAAR